jgi:hypothetical protein
MAQDVNRQLLTAETQVRYQDSLCGISGEQTGSGQDFIVVFGYYLPVSFQQSSDFNKTTTDCRYS